MDRRFLCVIVLLTIFTKAACDPKCLDFRAPFEPTTPLEFCSEYSDYTCCSSRNDDTLKREFEYIRGKASSSAWSKCQNIVKQLLCQRCSPFAASIFGARTSGSARGFPGLCNSYCQTFYDNCRSFLWLLDHKLAASQIFASKSSFCSKVSLSDSTYCYPDLKTNSDVQASLQTARATTSEPCVCLEKINKKQILAMPVWAGHAGDGSGRLFVVELQGRVRIYNTRSKKWNFGYFLDLTFKASSTFIPADERGFLGLAFHPNYAENGRLFVYYTATRPLTESLPPELENQPYIFSDKVIVSEMRVSKLSSNCADPFYEKKMITLYQQFFNHNGGQIHFGNDSYLYIFFGDGGGAGDPMKAAQNKALLHGKVARIDVDSDRSKAYTIPPDNPFVGESGTLPEIYALGMRNPWRCGIDRGDAATGANKGRVLCGDVGQFLYEEIDLLKPGANYGWNAREGFECFEPDLCGNIGDEELPIFAYNHTIGKSVTGGVFYRGCESPALESLYIYGDYVTSDLFYMNETGEEEWTNNKLNLCGSGVCRDGLTNSLSGGKILSFGEDEDGEIYVLTSASSTTLIPDGAIYKIIDPTTRNDPSTCPVDFTRGKRVPLQKRSFLWETAYKTVSLFG